MQNLPVPFGDPIALVADRIHLWITVTDFDFDGPVFPTPFPVVLDTGFSNTFLMPTLQLIRWTKSGFYENLRPSGFSLRSANATVSMYHAAVWLHPNKS